MQYTIRIPKVCHEPWEDMTPENNGRHCAQCCKTVVDFTGWAQADILLYLQQSQTQVCGRFRQEQLSVPVHADRFIHSVAYSPMPFYKKIAAIFLLAFGLLQMSSDASAQAVNQSQQTVGAPVKKTTQSMITGGVVAYHSPVKYHAPVKDDHHKQHHKQVKKSAPDPHVMGKLSTKNVPDDATYLAGDVEAQPVPIDQARH